MSLKTSWFIKGRRAQSVDDYETWNEGGVVPTLNLGDNTGDTRATVLIFYGNRVDDIRIQGDVINTLPGSTVRRLTPMECERLQGFPEIKKCATFILCLDHQKNPALAGIQNLKWQRFVGSAGNDRLNEIAWSAVNDLSSKNLQISEPAQILVRINYEAKRVEILSLGKLLWSANNAESQNLLALPIKTGDFVQVNVGLMQIAEQITIGGEVELRQNAEKTLIGVTHGNYAEKQFGNETKPSANAVNSSLTEPLSDTMFTTLPLTDLQSLEQNLQTLFCFVKPVIDGFIPTQTDQKSLLTFQIESVEGWTAEQADSHRYKQMGNAVAVPVVDWIVKRLLHPSL